MNNKCVYVHKLNGEVVYVGSGTVKRVTLKTDRSLEHLKIWDNLDKVILYENLSIEDALDKEQALIKEYYKFGKLLNKKINIDKVLAIEYNQIKDYFYYDESSPSCLRWKIDMKRKAARINDPAGNKDRYFRVSFKGRKFLCHRIIYCLRTQKDLPNWEIIDHIDRNKTNNRFENLRVVSNSTNSKNRKFKPSNTGIKCLNYHAKFSYYIVKTQINGVCFSKIFSHNVRSRLKNRYNSQTAAFSAALTYLEELEKYDQESNKSFSHCTENL